MSKSYAQHCLCLVSIKQEERKLLEHIFPKVTYAFSDPDTDHVYDSPPIESCQDVLTEIDTIFTVVCPPWLTSYKQTPKLSWWFSVAAGYDHLLERPFFSKNSLGDKFPFLLTTNSGTHAGIIPPWIMSYSVQLLCQTQRFWKQQIVEQKWQKAPGLDFREMQGKTFAICGYGAIGRETARLAKAFRCRVIAANSKGDRKPDHAAPITTPGLGDVDGSIPDEMYSSSDPESFKKFLEQADILVLCLPLNANSKGMINAKTLSYMKKSAFVINIGRGGLIVTQDIIDALENENIAGAQLDVTDPEPYPNGEKLWTTKNCILTPHVSGWTEMYIPRSCHILCENAKLLQAGKEAVNQASWAPY